MQGSGCAGEYWDAGVRMQGCLLYLLTSWKPFASGCVVYMWTSFCMCPAVRRAVCQYVRMGGLVCLCVWWGLGLRCL
jgi:hypothetical protein